MAKPQVSLAFLYAEALNDHAHRAFAQIPQNASYLVDQGSYASERWARLVFTLEPETFYDVHKGIIFGSDDDSSDVMLDTDNQRGVSFKHFSINFTWDENPEASVLIIKNHSKHNTTVNGETLQGAQGLLLNSVGPNNIRAGPVLLSVEVRSFRSSPEQDRFQRHFDKFLKDARDAVPKLMTLTLKTPKTRKPTPRVATNSNNNVDGEPTPRSDAADLRLQAIIRRYLKQLSGHAPEAESIEGFMKYAEVRSLVPDGYSQDLYCASLLFDLWKLDPASDFVTTRQLRAETNNNTVDLLRHRNKGGCVVAKRYMITRDARTRHMKREAILANLVKHNHVVKFLKVLDECQSLEIRMDFYPLGSLHDVLSKGPKYLDEVHCVQLADQLLGALQYLSSLSIVHRDIKPENVLIASWDQPFVAKLSDFGYASFLYSTEMSRLQTVCGTDGFYAPEVRDRRFGIPARYPTLPLFSVASDIWSLGGTPWFCRTANSVMVSETVQRKLTTVILNGKGKHSADAAKVLADLTINDVAAGLPARNARFPSERRVPDDALRLLQKMLQDNPLHRPSADACRADPWITQHLKRGTILEPHN